MKVVSLFDGISCAQVALSNLRAQYEYYASEIDKAGIAITKFNFPATRFVGDVSAIQVGNHIPKFPELLIGGSPCQDLSIAGTGAGLQGTRSALFYQFVRILNEAMPKWFVLENVASMSKANQAIITAHLGVEPILINSSSFTAQNRKRLFWTNIDVPKVPGPKLFTVHDVWEKYEPCTRPMSDMTPWGGSVNKQGFFNIGIIPESIKPKGNYFPRERVFHIHGRARALTTVYSQTPWYSNGIMGIRKLTAEEAERLQGLPYKYTDIIYKNKPISRAKRFHGIGNGFTVPVIEHILQGII
jgi:site-specific DNA-cytosine methylase